MVAQELGADPPRLAVPGRVFGHRQHELEGISRLVEFREFVEERSRLSVTVRIDQRHSVRQVFFGDVAEHAAKDRDPDPACEEHVPLIRVFGEQEAPLRFFDLCLGPDRKLDQ